MTITNIRSVINRSLLKFLIIGVVLCGPFLFSFQAAAETRSVRVAVFDAPGFHTHSKQVMALLKEHSQKCLKCTYELIPIYSANGDLDVPGFVNSLKKIKAEYQLIHLSWNMRMEPRLEPILAELNRLSKNGIAIVAASGETSESGQVALPVEQTIMGQVRGAILIGELDHRKKLPMSAYFGSSIFTAFPPSKNLKGSSFTAPVFTAQWATNFYQRNLKQWQDHFEDRKKKSFSMWPSLGELFP